jgi:outer membrane protein TolC
LSPFTARLALLGSLAAGGIAAPLTVHPQGRALDLPEVLASALGAPAIGTQLARQTEQRAEGVVQAAQGAFDWSLSASAGQRLLPQSRTLNGFLLDQSDYRWNYLATVFGDRLFESGVRIRAGITAVSNNGDDARRQLSPMANRPQFLVDVPLNSSLGEPAEMLRLEAARKDLAGSERDTQLSHGAYLHQVASAYWKALAQQRRRDAARSNREVIDEVAARVAQLAGRGETAQSEADQWRLRAGLRGLAVDRAAREFAAARLELAVLLKAEAERGWEGAEFSARFPDESAPVQGAAPDLEKLVRLALERRPEVRRQADRVRASQLRSLAAVRETEGRVALVAGLDRVMVEYSKALGDNRASGARRQSEADTRSAELLLQDLERSIRSDLRQTLARLAAARDAARLLRPVADQLAGSLEGARRQVAAGLAPASALAQAADSLLEARRELVDAQAQQAQALADLRLHTATLAQPGQSAQALAGLLRRVPEEAN